MESREMAKWLGWGALKEVCLTSEVGNRYVHTPRFRANLNGASLSRLRKMGENTIKKTINPDLISQRGVLDL